jgi:RecA DNA recombination protein
MSSLPLNTASAPFSPANFEVRRAGLWQHIAKSAKFADVRPASQLGVWPRPEMLSSGVAELDAITGGIPCGCITVICGAASSGKTSALLAALAKNTQDEGNCVLIDASDSFDPKSAAVAGVNFNRLLWVRCDGAHSSPSAAGRRSSRIANDGEPRAKSQKRTTNDGSAHDTRRMTCDEQPRAESQQPRANDRRPTTVSELRLDQVLKTTDLILQSGGFGLVVLDLGGIPEKFVRRIPLASWFRFQRAVEHTKTALLVISEFSCAQTCAALVLELQLSVVSSRLSAASGSCSRVCSERSLPTHAELFQKMHVEAELVRSRLERKPMQSVKTNFITQAVRAG